MFELTFKKIGRVYILKSIFLAPTEKFGRSSNSVPHSHMVRDWGHEAAALQRHLAPRDRGAFQTHGERLALGPSIASPLSQSYPIMSLALCLDSFVTL